MPNVPDDSAVKYFIEIDSLRRRVETQFLALLEVLERSDTAVRESRALLDGLRRATADFEAVP